MHTRFYLFVPSASRLFFYVDTRPVQCTLSALSLTDTTLSLYSSISVFLSFFSFSLSVKGWHFPRSLLYSCWRRRGEEMPHVQEAGGWVPGYNIVVDKFPLLDTEEYSIKYT